VNSAYNNELRDRDLRNRDYADRDYRDAESGELDREISLGTATVLGIFLALALLCALFFGLGYSMGRRSAQPAVVSTPESPSETSAPSATAKPSPGTTTPVPIEIQPAQTSAQTPAPTSPTPAPTSAKPAAATAQLPQSTSETPRSTTTFVVQVAAVSHREDANTLITALEERGYDVVIRNEPQDKLLHIQVGPFATRKEADAMRQHLLSDGYNAIVK